MLPSFVAPAYASGSSWTFTLTGPNVALATATIGGTPVVAGDTLRVTGAGTFDTTGSASGGGSFTHMTASGSLVAKGTWTATGFVSFTSFGGPSPGFQGGILLLTVSITDANSGTTFSGLTMRIVCHVGTVPGGTPSEGTTILGLFPSAVSGLTLFHHHN